MVRLGRMYLVGLWKEHKRLMALLFVGGAVLVLAAMVPEAWATPNQNPLRDTIPPTNSISGFVCNDNDRDGVCTFPPDTPLEGVLVTLDPGGTQYYTTGADGWYIFPGLPAGSTHVVEALGVRRTVTVGLDGEGKQQDFPRAMLPVPVGGHALLPNGFRLLAPRIGLAVLMGVVVAVVVIRWRRQG